MAELPDGTRGFSARLIRWHKRHGRHDLPWQNTRDPYRVWLSEIMLQQTQVATAAPYYLRFLERFPTLDGLAAAPVAEVMALWSGLGYYARARNLHAAACAVMREHGGIFPHDPEAISQLPGIGRSTANSIATFCFGAAAPILDGNVRRVLCRAFGIEGFPGSGAVEKRLWTLATELMPKRDAAIYNQAQMDLGATLCTRSKPACMRCPFADDCVARRDGRVGELPTPRPKKTVPRRSARYAIIIHEHAVLLERRPPAGISGGVSSPPQIPATEADDGVGAQQHLGLACTPARALASLTHTFTHFVLELQPVLLHASTPTCTLIADDGALRWHALADLADAALPAPMRKILDALAAPDLFDGAHAINTG